MNSSRLRYAFLAALFLCTIPLSFAQGTLTGINGDCSIGGQQALTQGLPSTGTRPIGSSTTSLGAGLLASYPQCQVKVYFTGTTTVAAIYSDNLVSPTPSSNPFVANVNGSWTTFVPTGGCYDVVLSTGAGPTMPASRTLSDVCTGQGGGSAPILLQTNSITNGSQIKLNLYSSDATVTLTDDGVGNVNLQSSGGGGSSTATTFIPLENCVPDQTGNSFYNVAALSNWFSGHWELTTNTTTYLNCMVRIPHPLATTPNASIVLDVAANDATAGHTANFQACDKVVTAAASLNVGALSCASNQAFTTTTTAYGRTTLTYAVQSTVAADNLLVVKIATAPTGTQPTNNMFVYPYLKIDQTGGGGGGGGGAVTSVFGQTGAVPNLSGDITTSGSSLATLATVNASPGTYTFASITVDAKGRVTSASAGSPSATTFGSIASGTNTTAAMVLGTGGSLAVTGSGTIAATTAIALAANPTDCSANQFSNAIAASGNLTCAQVAFNQLTGSIAIGQTPLTTSGDLLYAAAGPVLARLAKGTDGQFLSLASGIPIWTTVTSGGNVSNSGSPTAAQFAQWVDATHIQGVAASGSGSVCLTASCVMTTPQLGTPASGVATNITGLPEGGLSLTDITTNNSLTTKHGFLKKLDNVVTHFMDGTGNWSTPAGSGGLADPGANGVVKRTSLNVTAIATAADYIASWTGTCNSSTYLQGGGVCGTPTGTLPSVIKTMSSYGSAALALAAINPGDTMLVDGTFTLCNGTFTTANAILKGSGFLRGTLQCATANAPVLTVSASGSEVTNLKIKHITNSPTAGGDGIIVSAGTTDTRIVDNDVSQNYNGLNLGNTSFGIVSGNYISFNNNAGALFTADGVSQVMQWRLYGNISLQNIGAGFDFTLGASITSLQITCPTWLGNTAYGNNSYGFKMAASAATTSGISDCFFGGENFASFNNNSGFYLDAGPNGGRNNHFIGGFSELSGLTVNTIGFAGSTATASNVGHGVEITSSCDPTNAPQVSGMSFWENSYSGAISACTGTQFSQINAFKNGMAATGNSYQRAAVAVRATNISVLGGYFRDSGSKQINGVDISNSADKVTAQVNCDSSVATCVKQTTTPTSLTVIRPEGTISAISDKGGQMYNVIAYGATGDGTTDDSTAVAAALALAAANEGIVYFPPGTYSITPQTLPDTANCANLQGAGIDTTNLKARGTVTTPLIEKAGVTSTFGCFVRDLTVDMNQQTGQCWEFQRGKGWNLEHLKCVNSKNATASTAYGDGVAAAHWYEAQVDDIYVEVPQTFTAGTQTPYCYDFVVGATDSHYSHMRCKDALTAGIRVKSGGNYFEAFHPYGPDPYSPNYGIEDWGNNRWEGTYCDTFQLYCLDLRGQRSIFTGTFVLLPDVVTFPAAGIAKFEASAGLNKILGVTYQNMVATVPFAYNSGLVPPAGSEIKDAGGGGTNIWGACNGKGLGDGLNAIPAGTYLQFSCVNNTGFTVTLTGVRCWTDNAGTSTLAATNNAGTALLTGAVTCNATKASGGAAGTQSATKTLLNGDAISLTMVLDGTSKQLNAIVSGVY